MDMEDCVDALESGTDNIEDLSKDETQAAYELYDLATRLLDEYPDIEDLKRHIDNCRTEDEI